MVTHLQRLLLLVYRAAVRSGALQVPGMRAVFDTCYDMYKRLMEAPHVCALRAHVHPGTIVVDVGANVGFFTRHFAEWTGENGRVLAIEPEQQNFERLEATIRSCRLDPVVDAVHAAAAERDGLVTLAVDPFHPAGHHLSPEGVPTRAVTVDDLVRQHSPRIVSFIKIDVQGAELRVLHGATWTLQTFRPALFVELDEQALRSQGASVQAVVDFVASFGYQGHLLSSSGISPSLGTKELIAASLAHDYIDALFTVDSTAAKAGRDCTGARR